MRDALSKTSHLQNYTTHPVQGAYRMAITFKSFSLNASFCMMGHNQSSDGTLSIL